MAHRTRAAGHFPGMVQWKMTSAHPAGVLASLLTALLAGCSQDASPTAPSPQAPQAPAPPSSPLPATPELAVVGNPESPAGATWTLRGVLDGLPVDLEGVLLKPAGPGPFPAVVLSHGYGGSAAEYGRALGREMRTWGVVAIAVNYTHAAGVPAGAPGTPDDLGASAANVHRAHATVAVLGRLGYVDVARIAAHGHSMGAFVTTAFVAARPAEVRVASHTAGGVRPDGIPFAPAPGLADAARITTPYQWHHGAEDDVVPVAMDQLFEAALDAAGVPHEGHRYPGLRHHIGAHPEVLARIRAWYAAHGLF
jgi:dienelactone hydrolase